MLLRKKSVSHLSPSTPAWSSTAAKLVFNPAPMLSHLVSSILKVAPACTAGVAYSPTNNNAPADKRCANATRLLKLMVPPSCV